MNVLFINPPNLPYSEKDILIEPIDILALTTYVQKLNNSVCFLDMDCKKIGIKGLREYIKNIFNPQIAILAFDYHIPLHTTEALKNYFEIFKELKNRKIITIFIGKLVTYMPEIIKKLDFDIGILGEPEITLQEILSNSKDLNEIKGIVYKKEGKIIINEKRDEKIDLNELPVPNRDLIDINDYIDVRTILTSRGCNNQCSFCPVHKYWGRWRKRNSEKIIEEIAYLVKKYNSKKILFLDDNSTVDQKRMKQISNGIIDKNIKVRLGCLASINTYDKETFELMYKAGFRWVHFGIESGSQKVLKYNNKNFDIAKAKNVIKEVKQMGYRVRTSFILDLPDTKREDMYETIKFIMDTQPDEIRAHFLSLRLGTNLYDKIVDNNEIPVQYIHSSKPLIKNINYSHKELLEDIQILEKELEKNNYSIIKDVSQWNNIESLRNKDGKIKFLSFCPSKYGIDWTY